MPKCGILPDLWDKDVDHLALPPQSLPRPLQRARILLLHNLPLRRRLGGSVVRRLYAVVYMPIRVLRPRSLLCWALSV